MKDDVNNTQKWLESITFPDGLMDSFPVMASQVRRICGSRSATQPANTYKTPLVDPKKRSFLVDTALINAHVSEYICIVRI